MGKKVLKGLGILVGLVLVLGAMGAAYLNFSSLPHYPVKTIDLHVDVTPARVDRGRKIVTMLCGACHLDPTTQVLTGHRMYDMPKELGIAYSRNITKHATHGIGNWTDGQIAWFLRTGIRPTDGQYVPPWMPKFPRMSDEDMASVIAFLRSDDPMVAATDVIDQASVPTFLTKFLCRVAFKPFDYPTEPILVPAKTDQVAYGRYLANDLLSCYTCHSSDFKKMDERHPEKSAGYYGGGNPLLDLQARTIYSRNITFSDAGIGKWSQADFRRAVKDGFRPDGAPLRYPMERLVELEDEDVDAIYAFLKTVPALNTPDKVTPAYAAQGKDVTEGQKIYYKYQCYSCHGETGLGNCDLRGAGRKYKTNEEMSAWIRKPSAIKKGSKMPDWGSNIKEEEYGPLCEYVRLLGERSTASAAK